MKQSLLLSTLLIPMAVYAPYPSQYSSRKRQNRSPQFVEHRKIQSDFSRLQKGAGITPSRASMRTMQLTRTSGPRGTQAEFNAIRTDLNRLFSQSSLNVAQIQKKIADLQALNPGRWPMPQDYKALLNARTRTMTPSVAAIAPPIAASETADKTQQDFKQLKERLGMTTSPEQMAEVRPSRALPGSQQKLNAVRMELNRLLSKDALNDYDIVIVQQKIKELESLNPPRWPRAQDYQEILQIRQ